MNTPDDTTLEIFCKSVDLFKRFSYHSLHTNTFRKGDDMIYQQKIMKLLNTYIDIGFIDISTGNNSWNGVTVTKSYRKNRATFITFEEEITRKKKCCIVLGIFENPRQRFLSFLHEMGHYFQKDNKPSTIEEERLAWDWALRYLVREDIDITFEDRKYIGECYCGYAMYFGIWNNDWMKLWNIPWVNEELFVESVESDIISYSPVSGLVSDLRTRTESEAMKNKRFWITDWRKRW